MAQTIEGISKISHPRRLRVLPRRATRPLEANVIQFSALEAAASGRKPGSAAETEVFSDEVDEAKTVCDHSHPQTTTTSRHA